MISLVKMHEDSEYEIFRLAESKNCFEMSFSPCVIILSFRRRSLMMNTKRYVGKKKKKSIAEWFQQHIQKRQKK